MTDDDEWGLIPPAFWGLVSNEEVLEICRAGGLGPEHCALLWRLKGLSGPAPDFLEIRIDVPKAPE